MADVDDDSASSSSSDFSFSYDDSQIVESGDGIDVGESEGVCVGIREKTTPGQIFFTQDWRGREGRLSLIGDDDMMNDVSGGGGGGGGGGAHVEHQTSLLLLVILYFSQYGDRIKSLESERLLPYVPLLDVWNYLRFFRAEFSQIEEVARRSGRYEAKIVMTYSLLSYDNFLSAFWRNHSLDRGSDAVTLFRCFVGSRRWERVTDEAEASTEGGKFEFAVRLSYKWMNDVCPIVKKHYWMADRELIWGERTTGGTERGCIADGRAKLHAFLTADAHQKSTMGPLRNAFDLFTNDAGMGGGDHFEQNQLEESVFEVNDTFFLAGGRNAGEEEGEENVIDLLADSDSEDNNQRQRILRKTASTALSSEDKKYKRTKLELDELYKNRKRKSPTTESKTKKDKKEKKDRKKKKKKRKKDYVDYDEDSDWGEEEDSTTSYNSDIEGYGIEDGFIWNLDSNIGACPEVEKAWQISESDAYN